MSDAKARFKGTQIEMLDAAYLGWSLCSTHIDLFKQKFAFYIPTFIVGKLAAIEAAKALPDQYTRILNRRLARNKLEANRNLGRSMFLDLVEYVKNNFPEIDVEALVNAAGYHWFKISDQENWGALNKMFASVTQFVTDHEADLLANDNMPSDFPATLNALSVDTLKVYNNYLQYDSNSATVTADNIKTLNKVYDDLMKMVRHSARVFHNDPDTAAQFTYASLLQAAGRHKEAGVRGNIIDGDTNLPLKDVQVSNQTKTHNDLTNTDGNYHLKGLGEGKDFITAEVPGYTKATQPIELKPGETTTIDIKLFKAP